MALNLGKLYLLISGKSEPLKKELDKAHGMVRTSATKMQKTISGAFRLAFSLPALVAGGGIGYLLQDAIKTASDLEEVTGKFNVVFRDQIDIARQWAEQLVGSYGLSNIEAKKFLSSIQDLLKPMGVASNEAARLSNEVVKLAVDLGSFNNVRTEDVIRDIESALVGNFETMKKYGVVLNVARIRQEGLNQGLISGTEKLTAAQRATIAYNLIVQGSADAIGDWHRTQNSLANQMKQLRSNIINFKGAIGDALLPKVNEIITNMNDWIKANKTFLSQDIPSRINEIALSLGKIVSIYESMPKGSVLTFGYLGVAVFGKTGPLKMVGLLAAANEALKNYNLNVTSLPGKVNDAAKAFEDLYQSIYEVITGQREFISGIDRTQKLVSTRDILPDIMKGAHEQVQMMDAHIKALYAYKKELKEKVAAEAAAAEAAAEFAEAQKKINNEYIASLSDIPIYIDKTKSVKDAWQVSGERTFTDEQIDKINQLKTEYVDALPIIRTYRDSWEVAAERTFTDEQIEKLKEINKSFDGLIELSERTANAMQENFSDLFFDVMQGEFKSLEDYAKAVLASIERGIADIAAQQLTEGLFGVLPKVTGATKQSVTPVETGIGGAYTFQADKRYQSGGYLGEMVQGYGTKTGQSYEFHPDEYVLPADKVGSGINVDVRVVNNLGRQADVKQSTSWASPNRMIAEIVLNQKLESRSFRQGLNR